MSCGLFLEYWKKGLEADECAFAILALKNGEFWRNGVYREYRGVTHQSDHWKVARNMVYHEDLPLFEAAVMEAKKTNKPQVIKLRFKPQGAKLETLPVVAAHVSCDGCSKRCGLVLFHIPLKMSLPPVSSFLQSVA